MEFEVGNSLKTLTQDNLFEVDEALAAFLPEPVAQMEELFSHEEWMAPMFNPQISANTPGPVRDHFEMSRSLFCYGYFYSPLFSLGTDKLYQALEWALILRCDAMGFSQHKLSWRVALDWLDGKQMITPPQKEQWETLMLSRYSAEQNNYAACTPSYAVTAMSMGVTLINALYPPK